MPPAMLVFATTFVLAVSKVCSVEGGSNTKQFTAVNIASLGALEVKQSVRSLAQCSYFCMETASCSAFALDSGLCLVGNAANVQMVSNGVLAFVEDLVLPTTASTTVTTTTTTITQTTTTTTTTSPTTTTLSTTTTIIASTTTTTTSTTTLSSTAAATETTAPTTSTSTDTTSEATTSSGTTSTLSTSTTTLTSTASTAPSSTATSGTSTSTTASTESTTPTSTSTSESATTTTATQSTSLSTSTTTQSPTSTDTTTTTTTTAPTESTTLSAPTTTETPTTTTTTTTTESTTPTSTPSTTPPLVTLIVSMSEDWNGNLLSDAILTVSANNGEAQSAIADSNGQAKFFVPQSSPVTISGGLSDYFTVTANFVASTDSAQYFRLTTLKLLQPGEIGGTVNWAGGNEDLDMFVADVGTGCEVNCDSMECDVGDATIVFNRDAEDFGMDGGETAEWKGSFDTDSVQAVFVHNWSGSVPFSSSNTRYTFFSEASTKVLYPPETDRNGVSKYWFVGCLTPSQGLSSLVFLNKLTSEDIDINQCSAPTSGNNGDGNSNAATSNPDNGAPFAD